MADAARDSGKHSGKRFIQGGRSHLRQALFMPALVATRLAQNIENNPMHRSLVSLEWMR